MNERREVRFGPLAKSLPIKADNLTYCFFEGPASVSTAVALFFPLPTAPPVVLLFPCVIVEVAWSASGDASSESRADRRVRGCELPEAVGGDTVLAPGALLVALVRFLVVWVEVVGG